MKKLLLLLFLIPLISCTEDWTGEKDIISERLQECRDKANQKETSVIGYTNDVKDCETVELTYEDQRLNVNYKKLMSLLSDEKKILLRNKQREWIKYRDKEALSMTFRNPETGEVEDKIYYSSWWEMSQAEGKIGELSIQTTLRELTKKRADELADMLIKFNNEVL